MTGPRVPGQWRMLRPKVCTVDTTLEIISFAALSSTVVSNNRIVKVAGAIRNMAVAWVTHNIRVVSRTSILLS